MNRGWITKWLCCMTLIFVSPISFADVYEFANEQERQRYQTLIAELRCPKCQNQNIADSNSPISNDLREQVYKQVSLGRSDQEIMDYMVKRYGQFVLYRPPLDAKTSVLWLAPLGFLVAGLVFAFLALRRSKADNGKSLQ